VSRVIPFPGAVAPITDEGAQAPSPTVPLHTVVAASRRRHRALVAAAGEWALTRGVSLPPDHVALWAVTAELLGWLGEGDGVTGSWRASAIPDFLSALEAWCALNHCAPPPTLTGSLWHLYGFLRDTGRLRPGSDSLTELRAALVVFGDLILFRPDTDSPDPAAA